MSGGLSVSELRKCVELRDGRLYWLPREPVPGKRPNATASAWNARFAGKEVAAVPMSRGYCRMVIRSRDYLAHRVVWALTHGVWPVGEIDHINGDKADNRIENLRDTDHGTNMRNVSKRVDNRSGTTGVYWHAADRKWCAAIQVKGKDRFLGRFGDKGDAIAARTAAQMSAGFTERHGQ